MFVDITQSGPESNTAMSDLELHRATSTTANVLETSPQLVPASPRSLPIDPAEWSIDDVMRYLSSVDSALNVHAQLFHKHVSQPQLFIIESRIRSRSTKSSRYYVTQNS